MKSKQTRHVRIQVPIPNANKTVEVPYGGTYYALINASGTVSIGVGDDPPAVVGIGIVRIMPPDVEIGKDSRFLNVTSTVAGDVVTLDIGYGAELPLEAIANLPSGLPPTPQGVNTAVNSNATKSFTPNGDWQWLVVSLLTNVNPPWLFTIQHLDRSSNPMTPYPPGATPAIEIYNPDGSVFGHSGDGVLYSTPNAGGKAGQLILFIPVCGAFQIQFLITPESGGANGTISGQFTNVGPGGL